METFPSEDQEIHYLESDHTDFLNPIQDEDERNSHNSVDFQNEKEGNTTENTVTVKEEEELENKAEIHDEEMQDGTMEIPQDETVEANDREEYSPKTENTLYEYEDENVTEDYSAMPSQNMQDDSEHILVLETNQGHLTEDTNESCQLEEENSTQEENSSENILEEDHENDGTPEQNILNKENCPDETVPDESPIKQRPSVPKQSIPMLNTLLKINIKASYIEKQEVEREDGKIMQYVCSHCKLCFEPDEREAFVEHKKSHPEMRPYQCPICFERFLMKSVLEKHRLVE